MPAFQKQSSERTSARSGSPATASHQGGGPVSGQSTPSNTGSLFQAQLESNSPALQLKNDAPPEKKEEGGGGAGTSSGLANYESTLGKWLGGKLYAAVADQITLDKLAGYAESGLKSALSSFGDYVKGADGDVDPGQVDKAISALQGVLGKQAQAFVKANGAGLQKALQGFVDANPELIVLLALLAAAGAVAANMKIPELKAKIGITDGLDAQLSVKLGKLRDISLEKIEARLSYNAGRLSATAAVALEDEKLSGELGMRYGVRDDLDLSLKGTWNEKDGAGGRLGLDYRPNDRLSIGAHVGYDEKKGANAGIGLTLRF